MGGFLTVATNVPAFGQFPNCRDRPETKAIYSLNGYPWQKAAAAATVTARQLFFQRQQQPFHQTIPNVWIGKMASPMRHFAY